MSINACQPAIIIVVDDNGGFKAFSPNMEELPMIEHIDIHCDERDVNKVTIKAIAIIKSIHTL